MNCPHHAVSNRGCKLCVHRATSGLSAQLLCLGPRTREQWQSLVDRVLKSVVWATTGEEAEFKEVAVRRDGRVMHRLHALALDHANHSAFTPLPSDLAGDSRALRSSFVTATLDILCLDGVWHGRAKTEHGMYDDQSMLRGIDCAGRIGVCRSVISGEYENAYLDLEKLISSGVVFATPRRVWSRQIAPAPPQAAAASFRAHISANNFGV